MTFINLPKDPMDLLSNQVTSTCKTCKREFRGDEKTVDCTLCNSNYVHETQIELKLNTCIICGGKFLDSKITHICQPCSESPFG